MTEKQQEPRLSTRDMAGREQEHKPEGDGETEQEEAGLGDADLMPLLPSNEADQFHSRWNAIQAGFVDDPCTSVESADSLVAEVMKRLAETFAEERERMESQWKSGEHSSTEDLRTALQRYRSFFNRLLSLK